MTSFLKHLRQKHGVSQEFLSNVLGVSRPTYTQIESGARDMTVIEARKLSHFFGLSLEDFLTEKEINSPQVHLEQAAEGSHQTEIQEMRISVPQKNIQKFKEVLLYILEKIGALSNVGEAVICKLLYFIDFDYYEIYEEQLIGATYIKNHHGPTPIEFVEIVREMEKKGDLVKVKERYYQYDQKKYLPRRKPKLELFSAREKELIDEEIERFKDKNAKAMEELSHRDVPWISAELLKPIDYETVFYRTPEFSRRSYDT